MPLFSDKVAGCWLGGIGEVMRDGSIEQSYSYA